MYVRSTRILSVCINY